MRPLAPLVTLLAALITCPAPSASAQSPAARTAATLAATPVSVEQFRSFRWIVGRWRGSGMGYAAFYEEYGVENDSTMWMRSYTDSTFTTARVFSTYELRNGRMLHVEGGRGTPVTRFAGDSVQFGGTLYLRVSNDVWRAIFQPRASDGAERYYELHRIR